MYQMCEQIEQQLAEMKVKLDAFVFFSPPDPSLDSSKLGVML